MSLLGKQLLDRQMSLNDANSNTGGYPAFKICKILNTRFYNAMPWPIQFLTKPVLSKYTLGNNTGEVSADKAVFNVLLPTYYDLGGSVGVNNEYLAESGGDAYNKTYIDTPEERIRKHSNGKVGEYWTRSAAYQSGQNWYSDKVYYVDANGNFESFYGYPSYAKGVLIEISFQDKGRLNWRPSIQGFEMYYKVMKDNAVLDVLDEIRYVKYQKKHKIFLVCHPKESQGIYSSDCRTVWHLNGLNAIPAEGYDTVQLVEIEPYEYNQRKKFGGKTKEEIIDSYTTLLAQGDRFQLIDSLIRCYKQNLLTKEEITQLKERNILSQVDLDKIFE